MANEPQATATLEPPSVPRPADGTGDAADPVVATCPYLLSADGHWRGTAPSSEHRCTAFAPPAPLAAEKQRRLCLVVAHTSCATYTAAVAARRDRGVPTDADSPLRRELVRTTPVVEVGVGLGASVTSLLGERRGLQAIPAIVLVIALIAAAASNLGRGQPGAAQLTSSPSAPPAASGEPSPSPSPLPTASASPSPAAASPSAAPSGSPGAATPAVTDPPAAVREYTVRSGDTLYGIAITFGTTVAAIKELNNLSSDVIHVGQVLRIP